MVALYIILGILLLIILLLLLRVTVILKSEDELSVYLKILFIKIKLSPKKKKAPKLSDFKIKKFRKRRLKEEKRLRSKQKKKDKKAAKKAKKEEKSKKTDAEETKKRSLSENISFGVDLLRNVILKAIAKFGNHLRIEIRKLSVTVSCGDPAKTAITYGYVAQTVSYLIEIIGNRKNTRFPKGRDGIIYVGVDYLAEKTKAEIDISLGITVWQVLSVGITALKGYLFGMDKQKSDKKENKNNADKQKSKNETPAKAGTEV